MFCPNCGIEVGVVERNIQETYPVKGENITITAHVCFCEKCGSDLWDESLDQDNLAKAFAEYRRKNNILSPDEIRALRKKYDLSQKAFARILGFGDKTITRYENGCIPDAAQNNLMLLIQQPSVFAKLLEINKGKISETDYAQTRAVLEKLECLVMYNKAQNKQHKYRPNNIKSDSECSVTYSTGAYWGEPKYA